MDAKGFDRLTPREREVLQALANGLSTKEVAWELGLTVETVKSYTKTIYAALKVHNRAEATKAAIEVGLVGGPTTAPGKGAPAGDAIAAPIRPVIGREAELATVAECLANGRLVSIIGIGGAGKTVLARAAGRARLAETAEAGAFVALEHIDDDTAFAMTTAAALGVHPKSKGSDAAPGPDVWGQLARLAGDAPRLLVLDNFENLLDSTHRVLGLLAALPSLRLLITSRRALGVAEEVVVRIDGLSVPQDRLTSPEGHGGVQLFAHEVARIDPQRNLGQRDLGAIGEICRTVGGLPLAIVLAASWIDVLSLDEIAAELSKSSELLTSESAIPARHRSLATLVDQSIARRSSEEQLVLARMSVFDGGFDRAAADSVAGASLQRLAALVRGSLVRHDALTGRFDLHPLVRERAMAVLERREQSAAARHAHGEHYANHVGRWADAMAGRPEPPLQREAVEALERERGNILAAWLHAVVTGNETRLGAMAHTVASWLDHASDLVECDALLSAALDKGLSDELWPRLAMHREYIRLQSGGLDPATCRADEALEVLQSTGNEWLPAAEVIVGHLELSVLGRFESAFARVQRLLAPGSDTPPFWRHRAQMAMAFMLAGIGQGDAALEAHRQGMAEAMADGDHSAAHVQTIFVALGSLRVNRRDDVAEVLAQAEQLLTLLPNPQTEASVRLVHLMLAVFDGKDPDTLQARLDDPVFARIRRENQHLNNLSAGAMALAHGARGDRERARQARQALDDSVAHGMFGEAVLWAELGLALANATHGDLNDARAHAEAGRPWERAAGMVTQEVEAVLALVEAVAAKERDDLDEARDRLDRALATPSLLTALLRHSAAAKRATATAT